MWPPGPQSAREQQRPEPKAFDKHEHYESKEDLRGEQKESLEPDVQTHVNVDVLSQAPNGDAHVQK
jgi:hypothetical protein